MDKSRRKLRLGRRSRRVEPADVEPSTSRAQQHEETDDEETEDEETEDEDDHSHKPVTHPQRKRISKEPPSTDAWTPEEEPSTSRAKPDQNQEHDEKDNPPQPEDEQREQPVKGESSCELSQWSASIFPSAKEPSGHIAIEQQDDKMDEKEKTTDKTENKRTDVVAKCCKIFTSVIIFLLVLGGSVVSKATLLFISANMRTNLPVACEINTTSARSCIAVSHKNSSSPQCLSSQIEMREICEAVTVRWIWAGVLTICAPYVLTFLRCLWTLCFKRKKAPRWQPLLLAFIIETFYAIGIAMLVFRVLPALNSLQGAVVTLGASTVPSVLRVFSFCKSKKRRNLIFDVLALMTQVSCLVAWPVLIGVNGDAFFNGQSTQFPGSTDYDLPVMIPVSLVLISASYWQNYIDYKFLYLPKSLVKMLKMLNEDRIVINFITSIWKCAVTILMMMAFLVREGRSVQDLFTFSGDRGRCGDNINMVDLPQLNLDWVYVWLICFLSGLVVYSATRTAAKIRLQRPSYASPVWISTPVLVLLLLGGCELWNENHCFFGNSFRQWFHCYPTGGALSVLIQQQHIWIAALWWLSQICITRHVLFPWEERLAPTEKLLVQPLWDGAVLEQHVLHNRRKTNPTTLEKDHGATKEDADDAKRPPYIYLCATMWHEEVVEMTNLVKSILRLDKDQRERQIKYDRKEEERNKGIQEKREQEREEEEEGETKLKRPKQIKPGKLYKFECHIFFDDAFDKVEEKVPGVDYYVVNSYVRNLMKIMRETKIEEPEGKASRVSRVSRTPFGGCVRWKLPNGNRVWCHLKNKALIKHKKRWSQVMYMYYLIYYRNEERLKSKEVGSGNPRVPKNTYILALDGDVDFTPGALVLMVDLMMKDPLLGAACGRIHPKGTSASMFEAGPMVWYQTFEYAIGHWLQKATEHVFGCVLCSPGCFSLFRASSLVEVKDGKDILGIYAGMPERPIDHLQYDQGEDRWLCTLLIKFGYGVAYCAAADALTFAPEGFGEFYNQRRRWTPSTMANIWDLLWDWKTVRKNPNVSLLYLAYQLLLFVLSLFGPGTICLMVAGAFSAAYPGLGDGGAFAITIVPVTVFIITCFAAREAVQILLAQILTLVFGVLQVIVLIGILVQMRTDGMCSMATIFFLAVAGSFILSAILHPKEFFCLIHGFIYFLLIPSMYMLLILYAVINLNVTSWGTRVGSKKTEEGQSKDGSWFSNYLLCCGFKQPYPSVSQAADQSEQQVKTEGKESQSKVEEKGKFEDEKEIGETGDKRRQEEKSDEDKQEAPDYIEAKDYPKHQTETGTKKKQADTLDQPVEKKELWRNDEEFKGREIHEVRPEKKIFFRLMQEKVLGREVKRGPTETPEEVTEGLKGLRDKSSVTFLMANVVLVVVIFTLQARASEGLHILYECGGRQRSMEPIGMLFIFTYGLILVIQLLGMLVHRIGTFFHIISRTSLRNRKVPEPDIQSSASETASAVSDSSTTFNQSDEDYP